MLIVEPDPALRSLAVLTLGSDTTAIVEAADAGSALALVEVEPPQVAVVDADVDGGGEQLCRDLKDTLGADRVKTVLVLPKAQLQEAKTRRDAAVDTLLMKPYTPYGLLRKVEEMAARFDV